eukprot:4520336-Prymnesium_polylepis.1
MGGRSAQAGTARLGVGERGCAPAPTAAIHPRVTSPRHRAGLLVYSACRGAPWGTAAPCPPT